MFDRVVEITQVFFGKRGSDPVIENCSFVRNESQWGGSSITCADFATITINSSIIAYGIKNPPFHANVGRIVVGCSNLYGHETNELNWRDDGPIDTSNLFFLDPLFCNVDNGDYSLLDRSPCLPDNNSCCTLMGAYDVGCFTTAILDIEKYELPDEFALSQNYPNPFNPTTVIQLALPEVADVRIDIFNLLGQRVTCLVDERLSAGYHSVSWDGADHSGRSLASGVYFYRIVSGEFTSTRKMVLVK